MLTQPVNSPDTSLLDLGFSSWFNQLNDDIAEREGQMIEHVKKTLEVYP